MHQGPFERNITNHASCEILYQKEGPCDGSWTEWSNHQGNGIGDSARCESPSSIEVRQKLDHYDWRVTGNILVHYNGTDWVYGISNQFGFECFDKLEAEAFPDNPRNCTLMEERYCCPDPTPIKTIARHRREPRTQRSIEEPSLLDIKYSSVECYGYWDKWTRPCINIWTLRIDRLIDWGHF